MGECVEKRVRATGSWRLKIGKRRAMGEPRNGVADAYDSAPIGSREK